MKTYSKSHAPLNQQRWQIGDTAAIDEWGTPGKVTGYEASEKDATGSCYVTRPVWWNEEDWQWVMSHPTDPKGKNVAVPLDLEIRPTWTEV
jgi:hypothetical protein